MCRRDLLTIGRYKNCSIFSFVIYLVEELSRKSKACMVVYFWQPLLVMALGFKCRPLLEFCTSYDIWCMNRCRGVYLAARSDSIPVLKRGRFVRRSWLLILSPYLRALQFLEVFSWILWRVLNSLDVYMVVAYRDIKTSVRLISTWHEGSAQLVSGLSAWSGDHLNSLKIKYSVRNELADCFVYRMAKTGYNMTLPWSFGKVL